MLIVGFSIKVAIGSNSGGGASGGGGGALTSDVVAQAQSICSGAFTPPLIRFPPEEGGAGASAVAADARSKIDRMLSELEPAITATPVTAAFTLISSYRNLETALASVAPSGGDAAEQNVMQLASGVSDQARALGIPACAPG